MKKEMTLCIRISEEDYKRLEDIAKKIGIPKTRLARNLIIMGIEDTELLEKIGAIDIVKLIKKLKEISIKLSLKNNEKIIKNN